MYIKMIGEGEWTDFTKIYDDVTSVEVCTVNGKQIKELAERQTVEGKELVDKDDTLYEVITLSFKNKDDISFVKYPGIYRGIYLLNDTGKTIDKL